MLTWGHRSRKRLISVSTRVGVLALALYASWFLTSSIPKAPSTRLVSRGPDVPVSVGSINSTKVTLPEWIEPARKGNSNDEQRICTDIVALSRSACEPNEVLCAESKSMYAWSNHFRYLKRRGMYLDIAPSTPLSRSHTLIYEQCLGWTGVCAEANPYYYNVLRSKRTCVLVKRCISDRRIQLGFVYARGDGGVAITHRNKKMLVGKRMQMLTCVSGKEVLRRLRVSHIDFMSINVEGHEIMVLQGIDWSATKINVIVVENDDEEINKFLEGKSYRTISINKHNQVDSANGANGDNIYVHTSVTWGNPQQV